MALSPSALGCESSMSSSFYWETSVASVGGVLTPSVRGGTSGAAWIAAVKIRNSLGSRESGSGIGCDEQDQELAILSGTGFQSRYEKKIF